MIKQVRVLGLERFNELARRVPELLTETLPAASFAGVRPIFNVAYATAPRESGDMAKAMHIAEGEPGESQLGGILGKFIGPSTSATAGIAFGKSGWYWRLVENGHFVAPPGTRLKRGKRGTRAKRISAGIKFVGAKPFLRPAFDSMTESATAADGRVISDALERLAVK